MQILTLILDSLSLLTNISTSQKSHRVLSQSRYPLDLPWQLKLTQSEKPQTCSLQVNKLWILPACCKLSTSCGKSVDFIKFQQICENQTCGNLIFADLLQVLETTCIKIVNKSLNYQLASSLLTTCHRLHDSKITSLQTCCNVRVSGCVGLIINEKVCRGTLQPNKIVSVRHWLCCPGYRFLMLFQAPSMAYAP